MDDQPSYTKSIIYILFSPIVDVLLQKHKARQRAAQPEPFMAFTPAAVAPNLYGSAQDTSRMRNTYIQQLYCLRAQHKCSDIVGVEQLLYIIVRYL